MIREQTRGLGPAILAVVVAGLGPTGNACWAGQRWRSHGPYGGTVRVLLRSAQPDGGWYAGLLGHGVYRYCESAEAWAPCGEGLESPWVNALLQNPAAPQILYAGTFGGVYWTVDGGDHWEPRSGGLGTQRVEALAIDPLQPDVLYAAATYGGVFKSSDAGLTWTPTGPGIPAGLEPRDLLVDPNDGDILYAATSGGAGVYKSVNAGATWFASGDGLLNTDGQCLTSDPLSSEVLYLGVTGSAYAPCGGVYLSRDAGAHWDHIGADLPGELIARRIAVSHQPGGEPPVLYLAASHGTELPYPPDEWEPYLFRSDDEGESWEPASGGIELPDLHTVTVDPADAEVIYAGCGSGGVYRSTSGGVGWLPWSTGLVPLCARSLAVHPEDPDTLIAAVAVPYSGDYQEGAGVYVSSDGGLTWQPRSRNLRPGGGDGVVAVAFAPGEPDLCFAADCGWGLFRSTDLGRTWQWRGFEHGIYNLWLTDLAVDPTNPQVAFAAAAGFQPWYPDIFKTTDAGETWVPVATGVIEAGFTSLTIDPTDTDVIYAGTAWQGIYKSPDGCETWNLTGTTGVLETVIDAIAVNPLHPERVCAGDGRSGAEATGVHATEDGGASWYPFSDGLTSLTVEALAAVARASVLMKGPNVLLYAGTDGGGVHHRVEGKPWTPMNEGLADPRVYALALGQPVDQSADEPLLFAGTVAGVYRRVDAADLDADGDVDLEDYAGFAQCIRGPGKPPDPPPPLTVADCLEAFDADGDKDVDLGDYAGVQEAYTG